MVRANVDLLVKLMTALDAADIVMIIEGAVNSLQERGVLKFNSGSARTYLDYQIENRESSGTRARR